MKMEKFVIILLILTLSLVVLSLPLDNFIESDSLEKGKFFLKIQATMNFHNFFSFQAVIAGETGGEYGDFYEGDMILNENQIAALSSTRNGLINIEYRWPNKTVPYQLNPKHTTAQNEYILLALNALESVSCVKFRPRTDEFAYVELGVSYRRHRSFLFYKRMTFILGRRWRMLFHSWSLQWIANC